MLPWKTCIKDSWWDLAPPAPIHEPPLVKMKKYVTKHQMPNSHKKLKELSTSQNLKQQRKLNNEMRKDYDREGIWKSLNQIISQNEGREEIDVRRQFFIFSSLGTNPYYCVQGISQQ